MSYFKLTKGTDGEVAVARAEKDIQGRDIPTTYLTSASLSGYATEAWVNAKGYITSSALSGYATETYVSSAISTATTTIEDWVTAKGYVNDTYVTNKINAMLTDGGYTTTAYVNAQVGTRQIDLNLVLTEVS